MDFAFLAIALQMGADVKPLKQVTFTDVSVTIPQHAIPTYSQMLVNTMSSAMVLVDALTILTNRNPSLTESEHAEIERLIAIYDNDVRRLAQMLEPYRTR